MFIMYGALQNVKKWLAYAKEALLKNVYSW